MSTEQDRARELAERIARRLADGREGRGDSPGGARPSSAGGDSGGLSATLNEIQRRLAHIEAHISQDGSCGHDLRGEEYPARSPSSDSAARRHSHQSPTEQGARPTSLSGTYVSAVSHPSQERFADIGEAVSELVEMFEREKTCNVEPGGKPCDHCGMCSSRGF
jgi:hypothetical protein